MRSRDGSRSAAAAAGREALTVRRGGALCFGPAARSNVVLDDPAEVVAARRAKREAVAYGLGAPEPDAEGVGDGSVVGVGVGVGSGTMSYRLIMRTVVSESRR